MIKLQRGEMYYLVIHKRDHTHKPAGIVPVRYIKPWKHDRSAYVVEQTIDGIKDRMTVDADWLAPYDITKAENLVHNMQMWELRIEDNSWRFNIDHKTAKKIVPEALAALSKKKRKNIMDVLKKERPELIKPDGSLKGSKIKMTLWSEIAWGIICERHPLKEVWPQERK